MRAIIVTSATLYMLVFSIEVAYPAHSCDQVFSFFTKTPGDHSLLIYHEAVGGECMVGFLHILFLEPDTARSYIWDHGTMYDSTVFPDFAKWGEEPYFQPDGHDGLFVLNDSMSISAPAHDSVFQQRFVALDGGSGVPRIWYQRCEEDCLDGPDLNFAAELVYYNRRGIYKNYTIREVWYWEESGYILVQTEYPVAFLGLDTMHGMLLYRVGDP